MKIITILCSAYVPAALRAQAIFAAVVQVHERGVKVHYMLGAMIEVPREALTADKVAEAAEFFSFGTNDLTQTTMGLSRDDYTKFSAHYEDLKGFSRRTRSACTIRKAWASW